MLACPVANASRSLQHTESPGGGRLRTLSGGRGFEAKRGGGGGVVRRSVDGRVEEVEERFSCSHDVFVLSCLLNRLHQSARVGPCATIFIMRAREPPDPSPLDQNADPYRTLHYGDAQKGGSGRGLLPCRLRLTPSRLPSFCPL
jgi:hypothetical protein